MYLVLGPDGFPKLRDVIDLDITERLATVLSRHVHAHVNEGEPPPREIAPAILNIAEDVLSGKSPTLRAGDYISLQQYVRSGGN